MKPQVFADVLRSFPLPVTVVTVGRGGADNALTVSWTAPVSFDPPQMMVALDRLHYSLDFLRSTKNFAINVLKEGQEKLAGHFARQSMAGEDKLGVVKTREGETGAAILPDALAYFDCEVVSMQEVGDHVVVIGRIVDGSVATEGQPLVTTSAGLRYLKFHGGAK